MKRLELKVYLKGGQVVEFSCDECRFVVDEKTLEFTGYTITGPMPKVSFVPSQIAAYTVM